VGGGKEKNRDQKPLVKAPEVEGRRKTVMGKVPQEVLRGKGRIERVHGRGWPTKRGSKFFRRRSAV